MVQCRIYVLDEMIMACQVEDAKGRGPSNFQLWDVKQDLYLTGCTKDQIIFAALPSHSPNKR